MHRTNALTKAGIFYQLHLTTLLGGAKLQCNFHRISLNWSSAKFEARLQCIMPPARRLNKTDSLPAFQAKNKKYVVRIVCG